MIFVSTSSMDGKLVHGFEEGWHWSKNKGGYNQGRDFFWVHLEIGDDNPLSVKLHVESPRSLDDAKLNAIKKEMVQEFLSPRFAKLVEAAGYTYKPSNRAKPEHVEKFKCTSPFHVVLTKEQDKGTHQANTKMVNELLEAGISEITAKFKPRLSTHFA